MPLPKIATPSYELELPSTGETIQYRPFLVKEEKLLVIALESEDTKQITTAIKTVIKNCILTKNIKVESLPTFDIEYNPNPKRINWIMWRKLNKNLNKITAKFFKCENSEIIKMIQNVSKIPFALHSYSWSTYFLLNVYCVKYIFNNKKIV